jgi:spermidine synthase
VKDARLAWLSPGRPRVFLFRGAETGLADDGAIGKGSMQVQARLSNAEERQSQLHRVMAAIFFLSGFASLVYEVVWMRRLALFFGSDVYSAAFTLSAFMGGLTVGSLLAARITDRLQRALFWYGSLEIGIGLYAACFPTFLRIFSHQYHTVYASYFLTAPWLYHGFRILVATVTLVIPTTMMGATLPLVVKYFSRHGAIGRQSGFFYSVNTCGALAGVLCVGFVLLPMLGISAATALACAVNIGIGVTALVLGRRLGFDLEEAFYGEAVTVAATISTPLPGPRAARAALLAIALSGMAALALEVVWMRILAQSFSATAYSFAIMLACFLFGIYYGSKWISHRVDAESTGLLLFGEIELGLGVSVALLAVATHFVPFLFSKLLWRLNRAAGDFGVASTVAECAISVLLILPPTLLMGAAFPLAVKICTPKLSGIGRGVGSVYAANTTGGIAGALAGGMVLIPVFGTQISLLVIAGIFAATGMLLLYSHASWRELVRRWPSALMLLLLGAGAGGFLLRKPVIVENYLYGGRWDNVQIVYHGEGIAHNVDIVKNRDYTRKRYITTMMVNGTPEADTTYVQRRHFILKAHLPLLLHPNPRDIAVVGLGLGVTLGAVARYPAVRNIELIELTREMVHAQKYLEDISGGALRSPKVHLRIDDGRNFMAMADQRFDMITADPIHPRVTGVGYLYTQEYYESIKRRLAPEGIVCQWMPMYRISRRSFDVAFRTFAAVFPHASFWYVRGNGLFIATEKPFQVDFRALKPRVQDPAVKADLDSIEIHSASELLAHMLMGPEQISRYLANAPAGPMNTDDNAYLEYHSPFEYLEPGRKIVAALLPYAALDLRDIHNLTSEDRNQLERSWNRRTASLLSEDLDIAPQEFVPSKTQ